MCRAFGHDPRVGGEDAVHVGVDLADVGVQRGGERDGGGVRAAPAERGDVLGVLRDALEAGDDRDRALVERARAAGPGVTSMIRARPCAEVVITPACEPVYERASYPRLWIAMASSAIEIRSPAVSSMSSSRPGGSGLTWWARSSSSSVVSPIAETTTTTSSPALRAATMRSATRLIRSALATEDPPYFCTTSATTAHSLPAYDPERADAAGSGRRRVSDDPVSSAVPAGRRPRSGRPLGQWSRHAGRRVAGPRDVVGPRMARCTPTRAAGPAAIARPPCASDACRSAASPPALLAALRRDDRHPTPPTPTPAPAAAPTPPRDELAAPAAAAQDRRFVATLHPARRRRPRTATSW